MQFSKSGLLECASYAFAPNSLHYCGPDSQADLLGYLQNKQSDQGLVEIINHFETLYPYLELIAHENNLVDPFDRRVVEAYWLGNRLLENIKPQPFVDHLSEGLKLKKKLPRNRLNSMLTQVVEGLPNHTHHVLSIYRRTGHLPIAHTLETMDQCRVSWGRVTKILNLTNSTNLSNSSKYLIEIRLLEHLGDRLLLGKPRPRQVSSVFATPKVDDWVSVHWGMICDVISQRQMLNLEKYTQAALQHVNMLIR